MLKLTASLYGLGNFELLSFWKSFTYYSLFVLLASESANVAYMALGNHSGPGDNWMVYFVCVCNWICALHVLLFDDLGEVCQFGKSISNSLEKGGGLIIKNVFLIIIRHITNTKRKSSKTKRSEINYKKVHVFFKSLFGYFISFVSL